MRKTILKIGLGALLAAHTLILGEAFLPCSTPLLAAEATGTAATAEAKTIQGKIANISQKAKTIALSTADGQFFLMKFTDATTFTGGEAKDFKEDEAIVAQYAVAEGENIATSIAKDVIKLPEGIKEIKTDELVKLLADDTKALVIDSRPTVKYDEGHIPGAISVPLAKLVSVGENEAAKLLEKYQDRQLIFYCGGST